MPRREREAARWRGKGGVMITPKQALETLEGVEHHGSLGEAGDVLRALLRRDWAVRVLDAWAELTRSLNWASWPDCGPNGYGCCVTFIDDTTSDYYGPTPEAARLAAALAVFPSLDRNAPNWPGECP